MEDVFFVPVAHMLDFTYIPALLGKSCRNWYKIEAKSFNNFNGKLGILLKTDNYIFTQDFVNKKMVVKKFV